MHTIIDRHLYTCVCSSLAEVGLCLLWLLLVKTSPFHREGYTLNLPTPNPPFVFYIFLSTLLQEGNSWTQRHRDFPHSRSSPQSPHRRRHEDHDEALDSAGRAVLTTSPSLLYSKEQARWLSLPVSWHDPGLQRAASNHPSPSPFTSQLGQGKSCQQTP
ncbi:uncharacterized protein LY79DRAFT_363068 [Colletotrichum navitas]|uniref:Uncharacterized protein n=1 Tax=Colletotrichum navitas TaxID=681940 RepID=A0AAD8PS47_9PEZI|nr:uncharacterized protein LY79DRAFT_363068 [Colletotrichum navitas]KAK1574703.1 hypothetical protein LY79DRAFT_363068 [Colletotrichum navitas]